MGTLPKFSTIGKAEASNVMKALKGPLSGYIGGDPLGGYWVERLAEEWKETFGCQHAVPCNSATSGLWAAVNAVIRPNDLVWVVTYTMSASAGCLKGSGARIRFIDIEGWTYTADTLLFDLMAKEEMPKAIIVTNLFGHPADLHWMRRWCDHRDVLLIEDNAQAPFAREHGRYTGTIGHIGVFSLNVHKHIQCGEGGVIVTDHPGIAHYCRLLINHGELASQAIIGLNLRMTEPIAAIASAQLKRGEKIVQGRVDLAGAVTECFRECEFVIPPAKGEGCRHVFYLWAGRLVGPRAKRFGLVTALQSRGLPVRLGYSRPLHKIFGTNDECPIADTIERECLITFEICAYDPKAHHLRRMRDIILQEAQRIQGDRDYGPDTDTVTGAVAADA
jgi:dTDP-4-amino-4,6-dideoxygalactose transaminase